MRYPLTKSICIAVGTAVIAITTLGQDAPPHLVVTPQYIDTVPPLGKAVSISIHNKLFGTTDWFVRYLEISNDKDVAISMYRSKRGESRVRVSIAEPEMTGVAAAAKHKRQSPTRALRRVNIRTNDESMPDVTAEEIRQLWLTLLSKVGKEAAEPNVIQLHGLFLYFAAKDKGGRTLRGEAPPQFVEHEAYMRLNRIIVELVENTSRNTTARLAAYRRVEEQVRSFREWLERSWK